MRAPGPRRANDPFNRRGTPKGLLGPVARFMPPEIKALFVPPEPLAYFRPKAASQYRKDAITGVGAYLKHFETTTPPARVSQETPKEVKKRKHEEKLAAGKAKLSAAKEAWKPKENKNATEDPMKTVGVSAVSSCL